MLSPSEVAREIVKYMRNNVGSVGYEDLELRIRKAVEARDKQFLSENFCDCCFGTGKIGGGIPCPCGGTGKKSDQVKYFRDRVVELEKQLEELKRVAET